MATSRIIGPISAYAIAKSKGYTGTAEQFATEIANASVNAQTASQAAQTATAAADAAEDARDSIPPEYSSMTTHIAPIYSTTGTYSVGDYVWYEDKLYRCIADIATADGDFVSTHWREVTVGGELDTNRDELDRIENVLYEIPFEIGGINASTGADTNTVTNRIRQIGSVPVDSVSRIYAEDGVKYAFRVYNADGSFNASTSWLTGDRYISRMTLYGKAFLRITASYIGEGGTDPDITDVDALAAKIHVWKAHTFGGVDGDINGLRDTNVRNLMPTVTSRVASFNDVKYTVANGQVTAERTGSGTDTSFVNLYENPEGIPDGMKPGGTYYIKYQSEGLDLFFYDRTSGSLVTILRTRDNAVLRLPDSITSMYIRLRVNKDVIGVGESETVDFPEILTAMSNEEICGETERMEETADPTVTGSQIKWQYGKFFNAYEQITDVSRSALSELIDVEPGQTLINTTPDIGMNGVSTYFYLMEYSGGAYITGSRRQLKEGDRYTVSGAADQIQFCFGHTASEDPSELTKSSKPVVSAWFSVRMLNVPVKTVSLLDREMPLYVAFGASTTIGSVWDVGYTVSDHSKYNYPDMIGGALGLKSVNLAVGSTGLVARRYGNDNMMDLVYANGALLEKAALVTCSIGYGNDANIGTGGLPVGDYDDYFPYDEYAASIPDGEPGETYLLQQGATVFGCLNWVMRWIGLHYPKAQLMLIFCRMSWNNERTVTVETATGGTAPQKIVVTDPYPAGSKIYQINERLKVLTRTLNIPLINMFEDGMPFNFYNASVRGDDHKWVLFSTKGAAGSDWSTWTRDVHPTDLGYQMIGRYIAGQVAAHFFR